MTEIGDVTEVADILQGTCEINWKIPNFSSISSKTGKFYDSPPFSFAGESWCLTIYPNGITEVFAGCIGVYLFIRTRSSPLMIYCSLGLKDFKGDKDIEHHRTIPCYKAGYGVHECMSRKALFRRKFSLMSDDVLTVFCNLKYPNATESSEDESLCQVYKKVLREGLNHDLILKVGDKQLRAHRDILRARSRVFQSMLDHDMKEKKSREINIPDCSPGTMELLLNYVYCGKVEALDRNNMLELYYVADKYEVMGLKEECTSFIKNSLCIDNICQVIQLALKHTDSYLLDNATKYFTDNILDIMKTVQWQLFLKDNSTTANELMFKAIEKIKKI